MKSIKDVARAAKVSVATVSRALQLPETVKPATRQRVLEAVERLGYTANTQARNLRTSRTNVVVALVREISHMFHSGVVRGIEHVAHQNGYSVLLGVSGFGDPARERKYVDLVLGRQADGLITLLPHLPNIERQRIQIPIVSVSENISKGLFGVHVDNVRAVFDATGYLIALGHRKIAFVGGRQGSEISIDRERGFREALAAAGLKIDESLFANGDFFIESGIRAVDSLFAKNAAFTAIFCCSDEMAIGAYQSVRARGLRVPHDVSIVGFDDIQMARYLDPPLTTISQPVEEMGREAMTMLLDLLKDGNTPPRKRFLQTNLVVRGSTAAPK